MIIIWILVLITGFFFLWKGSNFLIEGSAEIAKIFHIPEIIIGLTLLAFGTSLPEMFVNVFASFQNQPDIVFGNIIGSNITNILLGLGFSSLFFTITFQPKFMIRELSFTILASLLVFFFVFFGFSTQNSMAGLSFWDGLGLLAFFGLFIFIIFKFKYKAEVDHDIVKTSNKTKAFMHFIIGLTGLIIGGKIVVTSAVEIAQYFRVSQAFIALFIVALGTSLPEIITSLTAVIKGRHSLAVGNILGSNIFNILLVLGVCSLITDLPFNMIMLKDLIVMLSSLLLLGALLLLPKFLNLTRTKGILLFSCYIIYIVMIYYRG